MADIQHIRFRLYYVQADVIRYAAHIWDCRMQPGRYLAGAKPDQIAACQDLLNFLGHYKPDFASSKDCQAWSETCDYVVSNSLRNWRGDRRHKGFRDVIARKADWAWQVLSRGGIIHNGAYTARIALPWEWSPARWLEQTPHDYINAGTYRISCEADQRLTRPARFSAKLCTAAQLAGLCGDCLHECAGCYLTGPYRDDVQTHAAAQSILEQLVKLDQPEETPTKNAAPAC